MNQQFTTEQMAIRKHKLSHPNKELIIAALLRGEKWLWIQSEYNCTSSTISRFRKELGLPVSNPPKINTEQRKQIIQMAKSGLKQKDVAAMFGVHHSWVSALCKGAIKSLRTSAVE
jgi:DNA-binding NarL/FixJ family response regulator